MGEEKTIRTTSVSDWTWGDWVLLAIPLLVIVYAAVDAAGLPDPQRDTARRLFWVGWLAGVAGAGLWGVGYLVAGARWRRSHTTQQRHRTVVTWAAPAFGVAGMIVYQLAPLNVRFTSFGVASGFILAVMVGYAGVRHIRQPRPDDA